ncbi:MAG: SPASM domain-containing protein [Deltaproteobacteria bacterium]|nr:SPASM domain-containing protein [Deltaproteobacteria bacterium]
MKKYKRINIEISNICNLQCSFCPEVHREKKVMSQPVFRKIMAQVGPLTEEVCLHLMGEPLGHPQLSDFVDICSEFQVPVNLTSNGTLLNERRTEILLRPIVRQVNFSVHSFEANFGERDVSPYLSKVFAFTRQAFEQRPDLYINYRIWDLTDSVSLTPTNARIRAAIEEEYGFKLAAGSIDLRRKKSYRIANRLYLNLDSRFEWPSMAAPFRSETGFCHGLSNHFGIHADGAVVPCCLDKEAVLKLGDVETQPIADILAGPRANKIVRGFERNKCVEELCQKCDFIKRFDRKAL